MAQRVGRGIALLFHDHSTRRGEWSAAHPGHTLPPGKTWYPLYRRLGGPQGQSARAENLVPTGIQSQTVQPVVSRYTDCATRPTKPKYLVNGNVCKVIIHTNGSVSTYRPSAGPGHPAQLLRCLQCNLHHGCPEMITVNLTRSDVSSKGL